jgi:hypothetical protein
MADDKIYDEPSETEARDGTVVVDGPDGVDVTLTPEAAEETSHRLLESAMLAKGQEAEAVRRAKGRIVD